MAQSIEITFFLLIMLLKSHFSQMLFRNDSLTYTNLLTTGKLDQHLAEIDKECKEQMEWRIKQMAKQEGVTESLKAADQMEWVRRMNSIRGRAEELVFQKLVFTD